MTGLQIYKTAFRNLILLVSLLLFLPVSLAAQDELPDTPKIKRVTWQHDTDAVLVEWEASKDPSVDLYLLYIYVEDKMAWDDIYTFGSETLQYPITTDKYKGQTYTVTAMDTLDGNDNRESLLGENGHRAIELSLDFDACTKSNVISWTPYMGWEGTLSGYRIYGGIKGDEMLYLGLRSPEDRSFLHQDVSYDTAYNYYVEAINPWNTSVSPIEEVRTPFPDAPEVLRIDEVSVLNESTIEMRFTADVDGAVNNFRIMRRTDEDTPFIEVNTIWNSDQYHMDFIDHVATSENNYEYLVQSIYKVESCTRDILVSESNVGTSVLLSISPGEETVQLSWTPYESYETGLSGYIVQRRSGEGEFIDEASMGPETTSWQETIESVRNEGVQPGEIQYKVLALSMQVEGDDPGISASNIVSIELETSMQVPNAFTPGRSSNYLFKPVFDFAPRDYTMIIYDRGGRKLFETSDPSEGWDGTYKGGNFAMEGVYVYIIQYTDYTNHLESHSGNVTVIYPAEY